MIDDRGVTHYDQMPIPPVESQTTYFEAGVVTFGVEFRLLDDAIAAASATEDAKGNTSGTNQLDDRGVSVHVFGTSEGQRLEYLRFDCFDEDPHYHYVNWTDSSNQMLHIDSDAEGDSLAWAIDRLRTRLPQMLERAGGGQVVAAMDPMLIAAVLPEVGRQALQARFHHDDDAIRRAALEAGQR